MAKSGARANNTLSRDVGALGAISTVVAGTLGAGLFVTLGTAGRTTGPSVVVMVAITGVLALCIAITYSYLATIFPAAGSSYAYLSRTYGNRFAGFVVTWSKWLGYMAAEAVLALGFGSYLQVFYPGTDAIIAGVGLLTAVFTINLLGIRRYSVSQNAVFLLLLGALLVLIIPGTLHIELSAYQPFFTGGVSGSVTAAVPLFYAYIGIAVIGQIGAEVRNPERNLPLAMVGGTAILVGLYIWTAAVVYGTVGDYMLLAESSRPLAVAANRFLPANAIVVVTLGGLLATASSVHAVMAAATKLPYAWAWDEVFPQRFVDVNRRWRTPHWSLLTLYLVATGLTLWTKGLDQVVDIAVFSYLLAYLAVALTAGYVRLYRPELGACAAFDPGRWLYVAVIIAAGGSILLLVAARHGALTVFLPWLSIGIVLFGIFWFRSQRRGSDITAILDTLPGVATEERDADRPK